MKARIALLAAPCCSHPPPYPTPRRRSLVSPWPIVFRWCPTPPGGNVDVSARILQAGIGDALGQPIIVENKPGAGGMLAGDYVARARARRADFVRRLERPAGARPDGDAERALSMGQGVRTGLDTRRRHQCAPGQSATANPLGRRTGRLCQGPIPAS